MTNTHQQGVDMADRLAQMFKLMNQPKSSDKLQRALHQGQGTTGQVKPPRPSVPHPPLPIPPAPPLPKGFVQNRPPRPTVPHPGLPIPAAPPLPSPGEIMQRQAMSRLEREITHAAMELDRLHQANLEAIGTPRLNDALAAFELQARTAHVKMRDHDDKLKYL